MSRTPTVKPAILIKFLKNQGFEQIRQRGSHKYFRHLDGRTATVPVHSGEDLGRGILKKILKDIEINEEDFQNWMK
jgi:predicted RNA binding protein YcfA (HicA-like mRNA interferase family)